MKKKKFLLQKLSFGLVLEIICGVIILLLTFLVVRNLLAIYNPPFYSQLERYTGYLSEGTKMLQHLGSPDSSIEPAEKKNKKKRKWDPEHDALAADKACQDVNTFTHITFPPVLADPEHACSITIFSDNELTELAKLSSRLTHLKILKIRNTAMTHVPAEISKIQSLRQIIIEDTENTVLPSEIGDLQGVIELTIKNTDLKELPKEIGKMKHLEKITITGNKALRTMPLAIGDLSYLWWMDLSNNSLEELPDTMSSNQSLGALLLGGNRFAHFPPVIFKMRLGMLDLDNNFLEEVPDISSLTDLNYLSLENNRLTSIPKGWQNLDLHVFVLDGNKISQKEMDEYEKELERMYPADGSEEFEE